MLHPIILSVTPTGYEREYEYIIYFIVLHIIAGKVINFKSLISIPFQVYGIMYA